VGKSGEGKKFFRRGMKEGMRGVKRWGGSEGENGRYESWKRGLLFLGEEW
jgi:hypothetical protein